MENAEVMEYVEGQVSLAEELVTQSANLVIHTKTEASGAAEWLKDVKRKAKELEDKRTSITKPINQSLKEINALFKKPSQLLGQIESNIKKSMLQWTKQEELRVRREQEAARKKAEAAQKRAETWAAKAEERGDLERAEELREQAEEIVPDSVSEGVHKPEGIYTQRRWKAKVFNLQELVVAVANGDISSEALEPNLSFLDGLAKRLQGNVKIPGVQFYEEETVAART
jgi:predicted phage tail protein